METKIFGNKEALARYFADHLLQMVEENRHLNVALSGGSTPKIIFDLLSNKYRDAIEWSKVRFFWGDERIVPPDDLESNYGMTRRHLFDHVPVPAENIFRAKGELTPQEARKDYETVIDQNLPKRKGVSFFDLMLLGMGDDGHTASIFPHEIKLWDSPNLCEIATHPTSGQKRVTLTGKVINNAGEIIFLVTGENKAQKVAEIIQQKGAYQTYPASRVNRYKSLWLMDREAAKLIG